MVRAEAEVEVGEIEGGGEVPFLEAVTVAVEVVPPVVDVAGVTLVSGRRTSERFTLPSSRRKRTRWSPGSRPSKTTLPSSLFVCPFNLMLFAHIDCFVFFKALDGGHLASPVWREPTSLSSAYPSTPSTITQSR